MLILFLALAILLIGLGLLTPGRMGSLLIWTGIVCLIAGFIT